MSSPRGRRLSLSPARRVIAETLRISRDVQLVAVERRMELGEVVAARNESAVRPMWTVIILKAFAVVAAETPELRRSYLSFPWAHLYEHAEPYPVVTVEREYAGESVPFPAHLRHAHLRSLADLDAQVRHAKSAPLESVPSFRRMIRVSRLPGPLRRLALWAGLNFSGRLRERTSGTFGLTSTAALGAGVAQVLSPLTSLLYYGLFDDAGRLDVRMAFDHRVFDGGVAARALAATERVLRGPILEELGRPAASAAA